MRAKPPPTDRYMSKHERQTELRWKDKFLRKKKISMYIHDLDLRIMHVYNIGLRKDELACKRL